MQKQTPYNYYHTESLHRPLSARKHRRLLSLVAVALLIGTMGVIAHRRFTEDPPIAKTTPVVVTKSIESICQSNMAQSEIVVSLSKQHLWACSGARQTYETVVTTGAYQIDSDATPTGTWQISAKQTDRYLNGSDAHGSWHDHVDYWMPFDGDIGFHDASWQTFPFGDQKRYATDGSHGCVHLPTKAAAWLYGWASIGTTVTIQS